MIRTAVDCDFFVVSSTETPSFFGIFISEMTMSNLLGFDKSSSEARTGQSTNSIAQRRLCRLNMVRMLSRMRGSSSTKRIFKGNSSKFSSSEFSRRSLYDSSLKINIQFSVCWVIGSSFRGGRGASKGPLCKRIMV